MKPFEPEFFINNRAKLRSLFTGTAPIVITANGLLQQNSDLAFPFKQDSSFWYLTGLNEQDFILVMDRNKEYLILPDRPRFTDISDGKLNIELLSAQSGVKEILENQEGWRRLSSKLKRSKHAAIIAAPPAYIEHYGFYANPARANLTMKMKEINNDLKFLDLRKHITKLRVIKQPEEINAINQAIRVTSNTIKKIQKNISKFKYEYEVEAVILSEFRKRNTKPAFSNGVSTGRNSTMIHYDKAESPLIDGELILLDIGAEVNHYSSDITRTFPISGKMNKRQQQIFESVLDAQNYAYSILKPGVIYKEYEALMEHYMGEKLRELGLITTIDKDSVRKYFPHLTSHFMGLDTHDIGDFETVFEENMVITVEPGIYIEEEGIGIRLEDDLLITKNGIKNLSVNLPSAFN